MLRAAERPNILFIIADDASRESFGAYGSKDVKMPNLDRLAKEGARFEQAYNCNPKCSPARACLLTGRYSWQLEEACNHFCILSNKWSYYPFLLEASGYFIGLTGKGWGPGDFSKANMGKAPIGHPPNPAGYSWDARQETPPFTGISNKNYAANFSEFLDARPENQSFCFWLGSHEPHRAYELDGYKKEMRDLSKITVPPYLPDNEKVRGDLADYAIEVEWFDKHIGGALKALEEHGLLENTIIIVTSDHGMPFTRVKGQIYEDGFHVPFVVRWGGKVKAGRVVTDFITFPDLAPTLLEIAKVPVPPQMTGKSFLPQLLAEGSGRVDSSRDHTLLGKERHDIGRTDGDLLSVGYPARALRNDKFLYVRNFKPNRWPAGDPKYDYKNCDPSPTKAFLTSLTKEAADFRFYEMAFGMRPSEELYDMGKDPGCLTNLAAEPAYATTKASMWTQLEAELKAQGDPRVLGAGDIFDYYPYEKIEQQRKLYGRPDWDPVKIFQEKFGRN